MGTRTYTLPEPVPQDTFALQGGWSATDQGVETTDAGKSSVKVFQRNGISSVDDVDEAIGRFALTLLLDGAKAGHYGVKPSAVDGVLPPLETAPRSG